MNSEWLKLFPFFIDPKLKTSDKDLYREIVADLERVGVFAQEDHSSLKRDPKAPATFILPSDSELSPDIKESDKTLIIGDSNMSIFGKRSFGGENLHINSVEDWKKFFANRDFHYGEAADAAERTMLEASLKLFRAMVKRGRKLDLEEGKGNFTKFEEEMLGAMGREDVGELLAKLSEEILGERFFLLSGPQACLAEHDRALPLKSEEVRYLSWSSDCKDETALRVYALMENILERRLIPGLKGESLKDMEHILTELPVALALFNKNKELALHNASFIKLNLSAKSCLALSNGEQFNRKGELYRCMRNSLRESEFELFTFLPVKEFLGEDSKPSSEELGIISSSIAHELNNPLGGVSGALDVLLLDERPGDINERMAEMKSGVARCKKLVETFLGFSKLEASGQEKFGSETVRNCVNSAMELIRFRLIENNISLETLFSQSKPYSGQLNPHVLSMTIYLVIGDLLTGFGHRNLVAQERSANFMVKFREQERSLEIIAPESPGLGDEFLKSKLLNHLLEMQRLEINSKGDSLFLEAL